MIFIFGLVIGSFISAFTYRWPRDISVQKGRSFCDNCNTKISWYDNIPLLSFILLGGKCRKCKNTISSRYPLIELLTALLFVTVFTFKGQALQGNWWILPYLLVITAALVAIFVIDLENKLIPDEAVFFIFILAFLVLLVSSNPSFYLILFSAFAASTFFLLLNLITKGRGMGLGDVKLVLAMALFFIDLKMLLTWLFVSFITGAVVGIFLIAIGKAKFGKQIPFGPFIIASFFITLFWGDLLVKYILPYW